MTGDRLRVVTALVAVQIFFGLHYLAAKLVLRQIPPLSWATIRVVMAAVIMYAGARLFRRRIPTARRDVLALAVSALFGVVVNQVCFVVGLAKTTVTHSAIINTTIPVTTLMFAVALGRERLRPRKVVSLALSLAGVLLVLQPWSSSAAGTSTLVGDLWILVNAVSYAFFLVISKNVLDRTDPVGATALLLLFGAAGVAVIGAPGLVDVPFASLTPLTISLAAFVILGATVGAYGLNFYALSRADSSLVALFIYLQPLVASALGAIALGERPDAAVLAGGALIFTGVFFAVQRRTHAAAAPDVAA